VLVIVMVVVKTIETRSASHWPQTTAKILKCGTEARHHQSSGETTTVTNVPVVEYEFTANGRIFLTASGTIGNSNDLAAHLLLVLPFLLFVALDRKRSPVIRIAVVLGIVYGLWIILETASRGALLALFAGFLFMLWQASAIQRALVLGGGLILMMISLVALPSMTLSRLGNLFGEEHVESEESGEVRTYLFHQSLLFTEEHPLFGVGPRQFANFEGKTRVEEGKFGAWKDTHCAFTQVSAECGIPALIFFLCGLGAAIVVVIRTHRKARRQGNVEITNACLCYLLSMVGFLVAITFLPLAYNFTLPAMVGLAGSMSLAANRQLDAMPRTDSGGNSLGLGWR